MFWLILGIFMWSVVHLFPSVMPAKRNQLVAQYGNTYQAIYAIKILVALALMVIGWRMAVPTQLYNPPVWGRHLTMLFVLVAVILFGAAHTNSRIKQFVRHPMLTGVAVWALGHLLANGDSRSVVLFAGLLIWSVLNQITINRRDGAWIKPEVAPMNKELILLAISLVVYVVLMFLHPYFTGMPVIMHSPV